MNTSIDNINYTIYTKKENFIKELKNFFLNNIIYFKTIFFPIQSIKLNDFMHIINLLKEFINKE
jgi:hypothetical protein